MIPLKTKCPRFLGGLPGLVGEFFAGEGEHQPVEVVDGVAVGASVNGVLAVAEGLSEVDVAAFGSFEVEVPVGVFAGYAEVGVEDFDCLSGCSHVRSLSVVVSFVYTKVTSNFPYATSKSWRMAVAIIFVLSDEETCRPSPSTHL